MTRTLSEVRSDILGEIKAVEELERKRAAGDLATDAFLSAVDPYLKRIESLQTEEGPLRQVEEVKGRLGGDWAAYRAPAPTGGMVHPDPGGSAAFQRKSLGQYFTDSADYERALKSGVFDSPNIPVQLAVQALDYGLPTQRMREAKALVYSGTGGNAGLIVPDYRPGVIDILQRPTTVLDLVQVMPTTSDTINYVKEVSRTANVGFVAEATATTGTTGTKPESGFTLQPTNVPVHTAATWMAVTNKMLADAPAIRGMIDQRLLSMLELAIEAQILTGDGTGENFLGLLNPTTGIQVRGRGADSQADALYKAAIQVAVTGEIMTDAYVLNPLDWQTIRLSKTTGSGDYLMGGPSLVGADMLWGSRVVLSQAMPVGTGLVGSWRFGGSYFEREGAVIRTGLVNDQFVRNLSTILAEARGAWITFRPSAFCQVSGL